MLSFDMDHHVHQSITDALRRRGIDVITAFEDGRERDSDESLLERATALGRILVPQDDDLLEIVTRWQGLHVSLLESPTLSSSTLILVASLNTSN